MRGPGVAERVSVGASWWAGWVAGGVGSRWQRGRRALWARGERGLAWALGAGKWGQARRGGRRSRERAERGLGPRGEERGGKLGRPGWAGSREFGLR